MRKRFHTTIDNELLLNIKNKANEEDRDVNDIIEDLIRYYLAGGKVNECANKDQRI